MEASMDMEGVADQTKDSAKVESEVKLPSADPRDYIKQAKFQKLGKEIDQNAEHPWEETVTNYIYAGDESGRVAVARIFDSREHTFKLLIAGKSADGSQVSGMVSNPERLGTFEHVLNLVIKKLPDSQRELFVREVVDLIPNADNLTQGQLMVALCRRALSHFPDSLNSQMINSLPELPDSPYGQIKSTQEQQGQLLQLIQLASQKMPAGELRENFFDMLRDLPFTDGAYDKNFPFILSDVLSWVIKSRKDLMTDGVKLEGDLEVAKFPLSDLIKNQINSSDQLVETLQKIPVKPMVDVRGREAGPLQAEFVPIDKIAGGPGLRDWSVIDSMEGNSRNAFTFVKGFTDGSIDLMARNEPIHVFEVNGDYFIDKDGRHRAAALKALNIPFAPMMVIHYK